jgi:anti-anti-sigma factor
VAYATQLVPALGTEPIELPLQVSSGRPVGRSGTARLDLVGELCTDTVPLVRDAAYEILDEEVTELVLDFRAVTFVDGRGLSLLVELARVCEGQAASLRVRRPNGQAELVLSIAGLDHLVDR